MANRVYLLLAFVAAYVPTLFICTFGAYGYLGHRLHQGMPWARALCVDMAVNVIVAACLYVLLRHTLKENRHTTLLVTVGGLAGAICADLTRMAFFL